MNSSVFLTILVFISLVLPDIITVISSNFTIADAELSYYQHINNNLLSKRSQLVDTLKDRYIEIFYGINETNFEDKNDIKSNNTQLNGD